MKQKLLRLLFLPTILCTLLAVGSFTTAGVAHAATRQPQVTQSPADTGEGDVIRDNSCAGNELFLGADWPYENFDCFYLPTGVTEGYDYVKIYNVVGLQTGKYTFTWNWTDCNGGKHLSSKPPNTTLDASNADGNLKFAGYNVMCEITFIGLSD